MNSVPFFECKTIKCLPRARIIVCRRLEEKQIPVDGNWDYLYILILVLIIMVRPTWFLLTRYGGTYIQLVVD
jgi:hypothetical protein